MALNLLLFLYKMPDAVRARYQELLAARLPGLVVTLRTTLDEVEAAIPEADILMTFGVQLRRDIFAKAHRLRWVNALGTGVDGIVDAPSLRRDVIVTSTRGIHGAPMSELAFLQMLSLARDFPRSVRAQDRAAWERWPARLLSGKTVGILGVGLIAEDLAPRCKAFGMEVVGISRTARPTPGFDRFHPRAALAEIVPVLDFLILLIPLSDETRNIVDRRIITAMKPGSYLINLARGGVVDETAMVEALSSGHLGGAALDAFAQEPVPDDSPLWTAPHLILTPHMGGFFDAYPDEAVAQFTLNFDRLTAGDVAGMRNREIGWGDPGPSPEGFTPASIAPDRR